MASGFTYSCGGRHHMLHDGPVDAVVALADRIAADGGQLTHTAVAAMIADIYTDLIVVPPPSWLTHRRDKAWLPRPPAPPPPN
jgi:hypothetical protein